MDNKTVIITGVNGQLGQFMVKYLQEHFPEIRIIGTLRHKSYQKQPYIFNCNEIEFELMDLCDPHSIESLVTKYKPGYFINTAANAYVGESWKVPYQQMEINCIAVMHQLEAIRKHSPQTRYLNCGTSEEFACVEDGGAQNENTRISPRSPYGAAKVASRHLINIYRKSYEIYAVQNWNFNFESEIRGEKYLTRKVTLGVGRVDEAIRNNWGFDPIELGNIYSNRSWQYAEDIARATWMSLNQEVYNKDIKEGYDLLVSKEAYIEPGFIGVSENRQRIEWLSHNIKEYVFSAPDTHSIKEFVELSFQIAGYSGRWEGEGLNERFILEDGKVVVKINEKFYRPLDVTFLFGNAALAEKELGWKTKTDFNTLVSIMVNNDRR